MIRAVILLGKSYSKSESGVNPQQKNLPHRPKHIPNTKSGHSDLALT
jgi:hypothetical protein